MFPDFGAQHLFVPLMKNPDTSRHITTPLEMRRSALRDRNEESGTEAIARIKAIAAGKTSRSAFLDDSDVESSPLSSVTGRAENKENDDEMSSDDESPVQPVRRTKNRLVRKSQLEEEQETTESPSPSSLPKPRGRQRAVFISDSSDEESSDVAPTEDDDEDYAGDANSALVSAMTGLGVAGGHAMTTATVAPTQPAKKVPLKTQKAAPFAPRLPSTPPAPTATAQDCRPRSVPAPTPTPTPPRPRPAHVSKPPSACRPAARMPVRTTPTRTAPSPMDALSASFASPAGAPKPMRLKGLASGGPRFELAGELAARLYDHQRDGVRWMWNLHLQGRGGILADDMGLGKTLQVAAFAAGLLRSRAAKRVLCLAPTTLLPHWGKEFVVAGLKEGVNLFKYVGTMSKGEKEKALRLVMDRGGVLLTTYGMVTHNDAALGAPENEDDANKVVAAGGRGAVVGAQDMPPCVSHTNGLVWDWIVCDEGHKLKNPNAQLPIKVRTLPAYHRLVITGTPIQNELNELWALYDLCCPGLLGCETEFRKEFSKNIAQGQSRDATERQRSQGARASDELRRLCRPFMLRREKNAVLAKASAEQETAGGGSPVSDGKTREASATPQKVPPSPSSGPATSIEASTTGWAGVKHAPSQLGTKNDLVVWIPLAPAQRRLYRAFLESSTVRAVLNKTGSALAAINVLKKICDHPSLCVAVAEDGNKAVSAETEVDETPQGETPRTDKHESEVMDDTEHTESKREAVLSAIASAGLSKRDLEGDAAASGKAQFLRSLLRELTKNGHRTLVFSQSRKMLDVIEKFANQDGHALVRIDGNVPAEERHNRVERFQNVANDIPLALLTTQVGGLGLTLTAADRVVIYDPSWNPAADSQSVDRAYRIGQTRDVVVYRLISCGTVEEKVYRRQVFKGGLQRAGTQDGNHFRYFSSEDTAGLFEVSEKYGFDKSETMIDLAALHGHDRAWTKELTETEAPLVEQLGACGLSDHDLLFSKEDTTKAGSGATSLKSGFGVGGAGKTGGGGAGGGGSGKTGAGAGKSGGKSGGWKGVDSGWGGDAQLGILAAAAGSALAATPASFAAAGKETSVKRVVDKRGSLSPGKPAAAPSTNPTQTKLQEKLFLLKAQKEKQESLLGMPGVLKKLPDKGKSIVERIDALTDEIETAEAAIAGKHEGKTKKNPETTTPVTAVKPVTVPTPATVLSPSPSSPSPFASTVSREVSSTPEVEIVAETDATRGESMEDSFVSAANDHDETVEIELDDETLEVPLVEPVVELLDTTAEEEVVDLANMMGTMGVGDVVA